MRIAPPLAFWIALPLAFGGLALAPPHGALAQMQLQGAANGGAAAKPHASGGEEGVPYVPLKPTIIKPPGEDTIVGQTLAHDGASGAMVFDKPGGDLVLSRFALDGGRISAPGQSCSIDVSLKPPLVTELKGRPDGMIRYTVPLEACPFSIDILDGAVLVSSDAPICLFKAADCKITPGGLWGPKPADITAKRAKDLERDRVRIETTMRADFRALLKKAGKDKTRIKAIAGEQAGFSSDREVTCRDYAQESVHGFCSTQITEARVLSLIAKFDLAPDNSEHRRPRTRPKPVANAPAADTAPGGVAAPARTDPTREPTR
jgi:hypothetical protein